jgi:hypothetical protein
VFKNAPATNKPMIAEPASILRMNLHLKSF